MQLPGSESLLKPGIVVQGWLLQTSELLQMNLKNIPPFSHHPNIIMTKCAPWRLMVGVGREESGEGRVGGALPSKHSPPSRMHNEWQALLSLSCVWFGPGRTDHKVGKQ